MSERMTLVEIVARAICCADKTGACASEAGCIAQDIFGTEATRIVGALRKHKLIDAAAERKLSEGS